MTKTYQENCMLCGARLHYEETPRVMRCALCGREAQTNAWCEAGHYICDACHAQDASDVIEAFCLTKKTDDPAAMAREVMKHPKINMHGPEHHFLVAAVLLGASSAAGAEFDLKQALQTARSRAKNVPGGMCGFCGTCGAAVGAGIYASVFLHATPLSEKTWSMSNLMTAACLKTIGENGGPRCCKRDVFLALRSAVDFANEHFSLRMKNSDGRICTFYMRNQECKKRACPLYPLMD